MVRKLVELIAWPYLVAGVFTVAPVESYEITRQPIATQNGGACKTT